MKNHINIFILSCSILFFLSCEKPYPVSCDDGFLNQGELGVDCGGPCAPCNAGSSCTDGIQNGTEISIDCGGECPPCFPLYTLCTDGIQNNGEEGIDCGGDCEVICNLCEPEMDNYIDYLNGGFNSTYCSYNDNVYKLRSSDFSTAQEVNIEILIASENSLPLIGEYTVTGPYDVDDYNNGYLSVEIYFAGDYRRAKEGQKAYITSVTPLTIIVCNLEFSGPFNFDLSSRFVCD